MPNTTKAVITITFSNILTAQGLIEKFLEKTLLFPLNNSYWSNLYFRFKNFQTQIKAKIVRYKQILLQKFEFRQLVRLEKFYSKQTDVG